MFSNVTEIGEGYNGVCTSNGKCIHGVGNKLPLHRAMSARLNNQIEFIINQIMAQPKYLVGNGLFEAFQQNHKKWSEVEAGIYAEYMRGEGALSLNTLRQKHKAEQNHNNSYMDHELHQPQTQPQSKLKQPPELLHQNQTYETPKRQTEDLTRDNKTPPPIDPNDQVPPPPTKTGKAPGPTQNQTIQASYAENFYPIE